MQRYSNLILPGALVLFVALGALQGARVNHLRESEAFYRWLLAAATDARIFEKKQDINFQDSALFEEANVATGANLVDIAAEDAQSSELWEFASGDTLASSRDRFLELARAQKLQYATNFSYSDAVAGNVSVFNMFFGFRKVAANFIWLQVDSFWHQGLMHRMIPLMWTCVKLDPNFVDAYLLGAWHLAYNVTAKMPETPPELKYWDEVHQACVGEKESYYYTAIDFLRDGIRHNPRNYKLYFDLGFGVYSNKLKDHENAVRYLSEAVRVEHERWVPRMLYKSLEENGQYAEALQGWQQYLERFPETTDVPYRSIERNKGLLAEKRAKELMAQAESETDPATQADLRAEAEVLLEEARGIYTTMAEEYSNARLLILDAQRLAREGRYLEAIGFLDKARYEVGSLWEEASNLIIEYKQDGQIPLSLSEEKAVLRNQAGDDCRGKPEMASPAA